MSVMTFEILGILTSYGFLSVHTSAKIRRSVDPFGFAQARGRGVEEKGKTLDNFMIKRKLVHDVLKGFYC